MGGRPVSLTPLQQRPATALRRPGQLIVPRRPLGTGDSFDPVAEAAALFGPGDVGGVWLADRNVTLVGGNVSSWGSVAPSGLALTQSTAASRPRPITSGGIDYIEHDGFGDELNGALSPALDLGDHTVMVAVEATDMATLFSAGAVRNPGNRGLIRARYDQALESLDPISDANRLALGEPVSPGRYVYVGRASAAETIIVRNIVDFATGPARSGIATAIPNIRTKADFAPIAINALLFIDRALADPDVLKWQLYFYERLGF